jgi:cytidine deaminase
MATHSFEYQKINSILELTKQEQSLLSTARILCNDAYAPYSNFKVGAAVLLANGEIVSGVNIENASYPVGICAERSALSSAISSFPKIKISALAISFLSPKDNTELVFPCGLCRQFILECENRNKAPIKLIISAKKGEVIIINKAGDLLPFGFTGSVL